MTPASYRDFTDRLLESVAAEPDVVGLVALGSTSGVPPGPDAFSDHDFFVVTRPGAQERFRCDLSWLPDAPAIVLSFRETAHGVKALWRSGHLAEFAVFEPDELALARVNRWRVLLDRGGIEERMRRVQEVTAEGARSGRPDARWLAGMLATNLVVGAGRWARGERLSGHQLVRVAALGHLVSLLRLRIDSVRLAQLDDLDPMRRLERVLPEEARALDAALRLEVPAAARSLLDLATRAWPDLFSPATLDAVASVLAAAEAAGG